MWSLSYSPDAAAEMASGKVALVPKLIDVLRTLSKEKVIRVSLACLRNLLKAGSASESMVSYGIMKVLEGLQHRKWADEDVLVDVEFLLQVHAPPPPPPLRSTASFTAASPPPLCV